MRISHPQIVGSGGIAWRLVMDFVVGFTRTNCGLSLPETKPQ
ncbi:MAG: hypothetical protein WA269_01995 [Candidatus Udaeobacter sp.]